MMEAGKSKGQIQLGDQLAPPTPQIHGLKRRLEGVRKSKDLSLNAWHALLSKRDGFDWSYEGIRLYHREDHQREPPVSYLIHVSREFGIELEYLATGQGPVKRLQPPEGQDAEELRILRERAAWFFDATDELTQFLFRQMWERILKAIMDNQDLSPPQMADVGVLILDLAREPLRIFGQAGRMDPTFLEIYFSGALEAIETAVPTFQMGPTYYDELMARARGENDASPEEEALVGDGGGRGDEESPL